jgi:hypothetical protein
MRSSWSMEQMKFPDQEARQVAQNVTELLQQQERLLAFPMNRDDIAIYEIRSEQIRDLIAKLSNPPTASTCL